MGTEHTGGLVVLETCLMLVVLLMVLMVVLVVMLMVELVALVVFCLPLGFSKALAPISACSAGTWWWYWFWLVVVGSGWS